MTLATLFLTPLALVFGLPAYYFSFHIAPQQTGDLEKIGGFAITRSEGVVERAQHIEEQVERVTTHSSEAKYINIGDSFSKQGRYGYVNYCAVALGESIHNLYSHINSPFESAVALLNDGYFERVRTEIVIIESTQRLIVNQILSLNIETHQASHNVILDPAPPKTEHTKQPRISPKAVINWLTLKVKGGSPVKRSPLTAELFTHAPDELYYYQNDLFRLDISPDEQVTIDEISRLLTERFDAVGVRLIIMCIPDKYELYQGYIAGTTPRQQSYDRLKQSLDSTILFDARAPLLPLIESQVKDIYLYNDSHWSHIAAKAVGEELATRIKKNR